MEQKEEPAPEGYEWQDVKSFDENGKAVFKRELVKLKVIGGPTEERDATEEVKKMAEELKENVEAKKILSIPLLKLLSLQLKLLMVLYIELK